MSTTAPATPLPEACDRPCPYHPEVQMVRAWQAGGLDELMIVSRRRERWTIALIGGLIAALLGIGVTAIWGGVELAAELGELRGTIATRLDQVETRTARDRETLERLSRSAADGQTTVLVTLGEMREQLRSIDARLERVEDGQGGRGGRGR